MKNLIWKIVFIAGILALCTWALFPPSERLKLGKDLAGGTTLTYRVEDPETGDAPAAAEMDQLITVIKERIDPGGIYDISVVAQGTNQIEITMPAPTPEVVERRQAFEARMSELEETTLDEGAIDEAVRLAGDERQMRFERLAEGLPERLPLLQDAAEAYERMQDVVGEYRERYQEREQTIEPFQDAVNEALDARQAALDAVTELGVTEGEANTLTFINDEERLEERLNDIITRRARERLQDAGETVPEDESELSAPDIEEALRAFLARDRELKAAREALNSVEQDWMESLAPFEEEAAEARLEFEAAREAAEATSVDVEDLRRVLRLEKDGAQIRNRRTGELERLKSPREIALDRLAEQYPMLVDKIDEVVALYDHYRDITRGYDDPKELISLLRGAGVLSFHIGVQRSDDLTFDPSELQENLRERGPRVQDPTLGVRWFPLDDLASWARDPRDLPIVQTNPAAYFANMDLIVDTHDGIPYILLYTTPDKTFDATGDEGQVIGASRTVDEVGRPAVAFRLDPRGAQAFSRLTGANLERPLAIVLDGRVFSAPTLQGRISDRGQITGRFSESDIDYLLKVLNAGALKSQMSDEPIAQNTLGPSLGADNLRRGLRAGIIALIVVAIFMIFYYFFAGIVANVALLCNAVIILGVMSLYQAAFTMPGIAGIILTFGMAVDANVLIYERIREEMEGGADLRTGIRLGYEKALSTIIDGNVTNLIVCFVLGFTATAEVRGFAITLGIGIVATLFSALFITRVVFDLYANVLKAESLPMLPSVWRGLNRLLHPNVQWVNLRGVAYVVSAIAVSGSLFLTYATWDEMLDTEFLGGTSAVFQLRLDDSGEKLKLPRAEVEERIEAWGREEFDAGRLTEEQSRALQAVTVYNYNIDEVEGEDFRGNAFMVRTTLDDPEIIERAVTDSLGDVLDAKQPVLFEGSDILSHDAAPLRPVLSESLGEVIGNPDVTNDVERYMDGVAIVLNNLDPPLSREEAEARIERVRRSAEYQAYMDRDVEIIGITRADGVNEVGQALYEDIVVLVKDEDYTFIDQREEWNREVADVEWDLVRTAMVEPESLDQVTTISPAIAQQFRDKAILAVILSLIGILAYVWVRFGSFRYSAAAIIALVHDVCITLGLLSVTHYIYQTSFAQAAFIEPFKIDLGVIAALLTIIGYSLNDTIVILDRIRENRGKLAIASASVVNRSINQTFSRTLLTSGTTLMAIVVMYSIGSSGIRPFTYAMLCGVIVGTYSTVGIAAPMVFRRDRTRADQATA